LPSLQKFRGIVVVIVIFCKFYNNRFSCCVKDLYPNLVPRAFARFRGSVTRASEPRKGPGYEVVFTPEHPIFSLAAQMRMRYQAVDDNRDGRYQLFHSIRYLLDICKFFSISIPISIFSQIEQPQQQKTIFISSTPKSCWLNTFSTRLFSWL
jgi:hypothetical protein